MSILLDAVNRKKQQQGDVADIMSTPSPQSSSSIPSRKLNKYSVLAVAIALGITAAWGMSMLFQPTLTPFVKGEGHSVPVAVAVRVSPPVNVSTVEKVEPIAQYNDGIRLAGKVALPIAKPFNHSVITTPVVSGYQANGALSAVVEPFKQLNDAQPSSRQTGSQQVNGNVVQANHIDDSQVSHRQQVQQQEPIVLGANANRRGLAELEALRLQVNTAAKEVDFASVKAPSIDEHNNLIAAFETALKDVEFEQSASQQMTEEKLDPIPRPSNQQIPKYGDLPASVQLQVPEFTINAHVYSTVPSNRWLNVDGVELQQGDMIKNTLTIVEIRPRDVVLEINGEQFRVPAI
ncbi:general secretion pathway protein GspB [Shewanella sp. A14]